VRVVLDTNILIASLIVRGGTTDQIVRAWMRHEYTLLTCDEQLSELRRCFARPALVPGRIQRHEAGRLMNQLRRAAEFVGDLPEVTRSVDLFDNFLLALAEEGAADYLVTGDKAGLLALKSHDRTRIVTARAFAQVL
jgi:putative PIN family toxin of toxin-antitoxin system